ncbi:hypothetical protein A2U01_0116033, partial [Trifolium medium]|nr:hypothetical protein [Trifolium medium]
DTDEIASAERPLGRTFFQRVVRDLQAAQVAAVAPQPPPQPPAQQEQHQGPPHIPISTSIQILSWGWLR